MAIHSISMLLSDVLHEWTLSSEYASLLEKANVGFEEIQQEQKKGQHPFLDSVYKSDDLIFMGEIAHKWCQDFKTLVVLGTGGSSLGAQTLCALKQSVFHQTSSCRILFMDNIDPHTFESLFSSLDFQKTGFLAISKSGTTAETLCQLLTVLPRYTLPEVKKHIFILTEPKLSPLRQIAEQYGLECFDHPMGVGGRFSVFANVGLLPSAIAGIDIKQVRQGACQVLDNPHFALEGAVLAVMAAYRGYSQNVLMPYIDRLYYFTFWFRQLWAESLGKKGQGTTPLNALGTVDQHSQLQLYLDGPRDKFFTLICTNVQQKGMKVEIPQGIKDLDYFSQKTMGDLMIAEQRATAETLMNRKCPTRIFSIPELNEEVMGELLMYYMLETMIAAKLLNINAFDQPAVEEGKILTHTYLRGN